MSSHSPRDQRLPWSRPSAVARRAVITVIKTASLASLSTLNVRTLARSLHVAAVVPLGLALLRGDAVLFFTALVSVGASLLAALGALDGSPTPVGAAVGAAPPPKSAATWESTLAGASPSDDDVMRSEAASEPEFLLASLR